MKVAKVRVNVKKYKDYKKSFRVFLGYYICHKLINNLMWEGKKDKAYKIVNGILKTLTGHFTKTSPLIVMIKMINTISLPFRFKKKRIAGRNFSIPLFMLLKQQINYNIKFFVKNIRDRNESNINSSFFNEVLDIFNNNNSISIKRRKESIRLAVDNKYYTKYL